MKTKELIRQLQKADPTGEAEVCVGWEDIHFVENEPAWYDGPAQILVRDPDVSGYNVTGGILNFIGDKIKIHTYSIEDLLIDQPEATVEVRRSKSGALQRDLDLIESWREAGRTSRAQRIST